MPGALLVLGTHLLGYIYLLQGGRKHPYSLSPNKWFVYRTVMSVSLEWRYYRGLGNFIPISIGNFVMKYVKENFVVKRMEYSYINVWIFLNFLYSNKILFLWNTLTTTDLLHFGKLLFPSSSAVLQIIGLDKGSAFQTIEWHFYSSIFLLNIAQWCFFHRMKKAGEI